MLLLSLFHALVGALIGTRFRVFALLVAQGIGVVETAAIASSRGGGLWTIAVSIIMTELALLFGYVSCAWARP